MCAPSPPPAPDYQSLAQQQGEQNRQTAVVQTKLNNPNVVTPQGTQTVEFGSGFDTTGYAKALEDYQAALTQWNAAGGKTLQKVPIYGGDPRGRQWVQGYEDRYIDSPMPVAPNRETFLQGDKFQPTVTQTLNPQEQQLYDTGARLRQLLANLGTQGAESLEGLVGTPIDTSSLPALPADSAEGTREKAFQAMMGRVNEDYDRNKTILHSRLIAAGHRPGSQAYDNEMALFERNLTDARERAFLTSGQEASRDYDISERMRRLRLSEILAERDAPLNEITALLSGSQVQNPFAVTPFSGTANVAPPPTFAAGQAGADYNVDLFNAQAQGAAGLQGGLFGLAGAGTIALAIF